MIVAGDRIYVTYEHPYGGESSLHIFSTADGEFIEEKPLPGRVVRDGIAVAYGRMYLACEDGSVYCMGIEK